MTDLRPASARAWPAGIPSCVLTAGYALRWKWTGGRGRSSMSPTSASSWWPSKSKEARHQSEAFVDRLACAEVRASIPSRAGSAQRLLGPTAHVEVCCMPTRP